MRPFLGLPIPAGLENKLESGKRGKKDGQGLYTWEDGKPRKPELPKDYKAPDDLEDRLILPMLNEVGRRLHDGVVADADLLDAGVIFGTGFAPFRGGPIQHIRAVGADVLVAKLKALEAKYGARFAPRRVGIHRRCVDDAVRPAGRSSIGAHAARSRRDLHRVRRLVRRQRARENRLDLVPSPPRLPRCRRTARRCRRRGCPARPAA